MKRYIPIYAAALAMAVAACDGTSGPGSTSSVDDVAPVSTASGPVIATYGGHTFTEGDFRAEMTKLNRRSRKSLEDSERREQFVENLILSKLIFEAGVDKGIDKDPEIRKQIADLERRLVIQKVMQEPQSAPIDDADVRAYYDAHTDEFATDRVQASHILIKEEEEANRIHEELVADPSLFDELAKENSIDKSNASRGGDLGFFGRGRMVKEFEEEAFGLTEDGQISEPIHTRFGYHIIKRTGREDGAARPFDEVSNQIRIRLINEKRREQTEAFLEGLKEESSYQMDSEALAAVSLEGLPDAPQGAGGAGMPMGH
jgi:peptidyl-prolyl cis-trans isomerase C